LIAEKHNPARAIPLRASDKYSEEVMARLVKHEKNAPYEIPEGTEMPVYICACGLSKNKPFCDGSHRRTRDEAAEELYSYDDQGRVSVIKQY
jgi:CDGSH-type Zn-finger protein